MSGSEVDYEVVEKGSSGFLGIGAKPAVIKARIKEEINQECIIVQSAFDSLPRLSRAYKRMTDSVPVSYDSSTISWKDI